MEFPVIRTPPPARYIPPLVYTRLTTTNKQDIISLLILRITLVITREHKPLTRAVGTIRALPITRAFTRHTAHPGIRPLVLLLASIKPTGILPLQDTLVDILLLLDTLEVILLPPVTQVIQVVTILNQDIVTRLHLVNLVTQPIQVVTHLPIRDIPAQQPDIRVVQTIQEALLVTPTVHPDILDILALHIRVPLPESQSDNPAPVCLQPALLRHHPVQVRSNPVHLVIIRFTRRMEKFLKGIFIFTMVTYIVTFLHHFIRMRNVDENINLFCKKNPDPHQNEMNPFHCLKQDLHFEWNVMYTYTVPGFKLLGSGTGGVAKI